MNNWISQRTAAAFNVWAETYEQEARAMLERRGYSYRTLAGEISRELRPKSDQMILEIGIGPGMLGEEVLSYVPVELIGVDISSAMIALAGRRNVYRAMFRANASRLPFTDQSFDGAFTGFCLHSALNHRRALQEIHRVLKPGATAVIVDLYPIRRTLWRSVVMGMAHSLRFERGAPANYLPVEHSIKLALEEGFIVKGVRPLGLRKAYSHMLTVLERIKTNEY